MWRVDDQKCPTAPHNVREDEKLSAWREMGLHFMGVFFWHMDFSPWLKVKHSPSLFLRKSCPHLMICCIGIDGCGFLIKLHIYMMSKIIYYAWLSTVNHRHQIWSPIHKTSINGRSFALSSLPWLHTIFTSYIFNANGVKTGVLHLVCMGCWYHEERGVEERNDTG